MEITEVRIKLMDDPHDRLQAFCSITLDGCFVIRDLKIIQGIKGSFVAMPSRKLTDRCPQCHTKNHLRALHCNQCGAKLDMERATRDGEGRAKLYADIAHPINCDCREQIQLRVLEAYSQELIRSKEPGYMCTYDDYGEENYAALYESEEDSLPPPSFVRSNGARHRLEPPNLQPSAPHHNAPMRSREAVHASAVHGDGLGMHDGDNFGEGLL